MSIISFIKRLLRSNKVSQVATQYTHIPVFIATLTGKAAALANSLKEKGDPQGIKFENILLQNFDSYDFFKNDIVIFILSTGGNGDPPLNATKFSKWIESSNNLNLCGKKYAIFGLGNSLFANFNSFAKNIDRKLRSAGGIQISPLVLGDASNNLFKTYQEWESEVIPLIKIESKLLSRKIKKSTTAHSQSDLAEDVVRKKEKEKSDSACISSIEIYDDNTSLERTASRVSTNNTSLDKVFMKIRVDITGSRFENQYETGAGLSVWIPNSEDDINFIASRFSFDLKRILNFEDSSCFSPYPNSCTLKEFLMYYVNLHSVSLEIKNRFVSMSPEVKTFFDRIENNSEPYHHHSLIEFFEACPSINLTWEEFQKNIPVLRPQSFIIGSSSITSPSHIDIIKIGKGEKTSVKGRKMVSTRRNSLGELDYEWRDQPTLNFIQSYLKREKTGVFEKNVSPVRILTAKSFVAQTPLESDVICIAKNDGIAAIWGIVNERKYHKDDGKSVGKLIIYYECPRMCDNIFKKEFETYQSNDYLEIFVCYSNSPKDNSTNGNFIKYLVSSNIKKIWKKIDEENAHVVICGSCAFGESVQGIFYDDPIMYEKYFHSRVHGEYI